MKKILILLSMLLTLSTTVAAKGSSHVYSESSSSAIITPDLAVGMRRWTYYTNDTAGNMVVCTRENYGRGSTCAGGWILAKSTIPAGRTYAGFRIMYQGSGSDYLELYWK